MSDDRAPAAAAARIASFAPVAHADARVLILGSMPGVASLRAQQYYAHPHNQFWKLMGELYGTGSAHDYARRLEALQHRQVALWDVLHSCVRAGSLDTAIEEALPNDLPDFLCRHPFIARICCNGTHAYEACRRHFGAVLTRDFPRLSVLRLPSTSPANASWTYARKLTAWRAALLP